MIMNLQPRPQGRGTSSQQVIKDQNTTLLFNLVRKLAPISRAELARRSGLSPATVSMLIEDLISNGWIQEISRPAQTGDRGRRPILLEVNASSGYVATVELLSDGYIYSLYNICLHKIASSRSHSTSSDGRQILHALREMLRIEGVDEAALLGVHILFPGLFNAETGELSFSAVIPEHNLVQRDLAAYLRRKLPQAQVMISNDATVVAYSEFISEADAATPLLALVIHEGISGGIVVSNRSCMPVEAGHIIIQRDGPSCKCGNRGCLETFCATPALFRAINEKTDLHLEFRDTYGADCNVAAMAQVADAFERGNPAVTEVLRDYAYALCCGVISIVNLFSVRTVRIGGTVKALGDGFARMLQQTLDEQFRILTSSRTLAVELFEDECEPCRRAAVMLTIERIFQNN